MKLSEFDTGKTCGDVEFERMTPEDFDEVGMEIGATFGHSSIPSIAFDGVRAENARLREALGKTRRALTAGSSLAAAERNTFYWQPVIATIDAALAMRATLAQGGSDVR